MPVVKMSWRERRHACWMTLQMLRVPAVRHRPGYRVILRHALQYLLGRRKLIVPDAPDARA